MNPNIIKKSPTKQFITPTYPVSLRSNKNGMHSSIQESTKSELSLKEHQNSVGSQQVTVPLNSGFNKVKKEEIIISPGLRTHHSEKTILYKPENWPELKKTTESPDKNGDYYGFKGTHKFLNPRLKVEQKLSDSGNSDFSQNSGNSNGKAQPKIAKFISKKKEIELPMFKPDLFVSKVKPIILQQKSSQFHKFTPYDNSPHKKQDLTNPSTDNIAYKRSSLSPQNKLPLNRQISHETFGVFKTNFTPKKSTTPIKNIQKDITMQKNSQTQKLKKQKQFYRQEAQKKQQKNDFSFNKQHETPRKSRSIYLAPMISMLNFVHQAISFTQLEKLAENKSSCIYKCLHQSTNMVFCIKKSAVDNHNLDQLIVQHKVATYLDHPNLVRGFATFYDRSYLYLLMEYMEDRSLAVIMKDKLKFGNAPMSPRMKNPQIFRMNPRETLKQKSRLSQMYSKTQNQSQENLQRLYQIKAILQQILEGLFFLHENGIMHRDLKPDNIFVSNNNYKIGDFGSCSYTNSQQYYGTLDYAAPEIMLKQKYDKSIDLWSLGCVAYQLDTGSPPFYHYNRGETMRRIVNVEYNAELISDFHLKKFIAKLLVRTGRITAGEALMEVKMMEFGGHGVRPRPSWGQ